MKTTHGKIKAIGRDAQQHHEMRWNVTKSYSSYSFLLLLHRPRLTALPATFDKFGSCGRNSAPSFFRIFFFPNGLSRRVIREKKPHHHKQLLHSGKPLSYHHAPRSFFPHLPPEAEGEEPCNDETLTFLRLLRANRRWTRWT
jgi:hypothetical protein